MVIRKPFDEIFLPDGIGIFAKKTTTDMLTIENGIIAVDRPYHPALLNGLQRLHSDFCAHPYYDGLCKGLQYHFAYKYNQKKHDEFVLFVAFDDSSLETDTSQNSFSSWAGLTHQSLLPGTS